MRILKTTLMTTATRAIKTRAKTKAKKGMAAISLKRGIKAI